MNLNETKKDLNPEIKKELEKSKLEVLTNENDFLVKNLKKAGWSTRAFKNFSNNEEDPDEGVVPGVRFDVDIEYGPNIKI